MTSDPGAVTGRRPAILFVDDEPNVLSGLRRMLRPQAAEWDMHWAEGGAQALEELSRRAFDVVVTDMRMPVVDGAALLEEVRAKYPTTARLVLSGHADREMIISAAGPTQQFLAKPCDSATLLETLQTVIDAANLLDDDHLRTLIGSVRALPKPPAVYNELVALASRPDTSLEDVVRVVERDVATSTEVLKLVNSAFFGLPVHVESVDRAVGLLGLDTIQALALAGSVFKGGLVLPEGLDATALAGSSLRTGLLARKIGLCEHWQAQVLGHLCLAGLVQDVGLLVLASANPTAWDRLRGDPRWAANAAAVGEVADGRLGEPNARDQRAAEVDAFGCTVARASAYLLRLWGFPATVVAAVADQPLDLGGPASLVASPVSLAVAFAKLQSLAPGLRPATTITEALDLARLERWMAACGNA